MNRRGQGLSINLIILVAIGLIVLIIAIVLVNRSGRTLSEGTGACINKGGTCKISCDTGEEQIDKDGGALCEKTRDGSPQLCCRYNFGATTP